ncbi:MAG: Na+/H+ antiporter NhaA [Chitinophagales bacterium]
MKPNELFGKMDTPQLSALLILGCTIVSLIAANTAFGANYVGFWNLPLLNLSVHGHVLTVSMLVNDVLMPFFFLLIGLEIREEFEIGSLSNVKTALLPVIAALGGMILPALIYFGFNHHSNAINGWGIPMATDIAFALAIMTMLGNRVPTSLKLFLTTLAVADDLGAVLVIAVFYTAELQMVYIALALLTAVVLIVSGRKLGWFWPVMAGGVLLWYFTLLAGIHTTIAGVILAFAVPDEKSDKEGWLQQFLHLPVNLLVLPVFALSATAISLGGFNAQQFRSGLMWGVIAGLVIGKAIGIYLFSRMAVRFRIANLPEGVNWRQLFGTSVLGGIGFTMSIFIASLAFTSSAMVNEAKLAILIGSAIAATGGTMILFRKTA